MKFVFSIILVFGIFCVTDGQILSSDEPDYEEDLVHFGDLIDVDVNGSVEYDWRGTLNPEGYLNGPDGVEEPIFALCRTEEDIAAQIIKGLSMFLREPKVSVKILDRSNRPPSVMYGAVKKEQRFQLKRTVLLNELIVLSGGFTEDASGVIEIYRPKNLSCVTNTGSANETGADDGGKFIRTRQDTTNQLINISIGDLLAGKENVRILNGDIITILKAQPVYVTGGVANPKKVFFRARLTLSRVIASVGGLSENADPDDVTIFRREGGITRIIETSYDKIKANSAKDIILQPYDIVEVGIRGRAKKKIAPYLNVGSDEEKPVGELPLRIVD